MELSPPITSVNRFQVRGHRKWRPQHGFHPGPSAWLQAILKAFGLSGKGWELPEQWSAPVDEKHEITGLDFIPNEKAPAMESRPAFQTDNRSLPGPPIAGSAVHFQTGSYENEATASEILVDENLVGMEDALWFIDYQGACGINLISRRRTQNGFDLH
jgi:hypothetical protein